MHVHIAKVGESLFEGEAVSVNLPGAEGDMTILANHSPLVTTLRPGTLRVTDKHETHTYEVQKGLVEISHNQVIVLL